MDINFFIYTFKLYGTPDGVFKTLMVLPRGVLDNVRHSYSTVCLAVRVPRAAVTIAEFKI